MAFNLNGLTQVITRAGNLGAETKSWKQNEGGGGKKHIRQPCAETVLCVPAAFNGK